MRQSTERDEINARGRNSSQAGRISTDVARCFEQHTWRLLAYQFHSAPHHLGVHVVQQQDFRPSTQSLLHLSERLTLNFDLQQMGSQMACSSNSLRNSSCCLNMVIFDKDAIVQTETMVVTTSQSHRLLLKRSQ